MRASENRYRLLTEAAPHMTWTMLPDQKLEFFSGSWTRFTGLSREEINRDGWLSLIHPDDRARVGAEIGGPLARGDTHEVEFRIRRHDGAYRWVTVREVPIYDNRGAVEKWLGTTTDVHDRKLAQQAELELRESEERFRLLLEGVTDYSIITLDPEGRVTSWNRGAQRIYG